MLIFGMVACGSSDSKDSSSADTNTSTSNSNSNSDDSSVIDESEPKELYSDDHVLVQDVTGADVEAVYKYTIYKGDNKEEWKYEFVDTPVEVSYITDNLIKISLVGEKTTSCKFYDLANEKMSDWFFNAMSSDENSIIFVKYDSDEGCLTLNVQNIFDTEATNVIKLTDYKDSKIAVKSAEFNETKDKINAVIVNNDAEENVSFDLN